MISLNKFVMSGLLAVCVSAIPAFAGPVTWTFGDDAMNGGIVFNGGETISGSFQFDPNATALPNQPYGTYTNFNVSSTAGTVLPAASWYVNTNNYTDVGPLGPSADCCTDNTGFIAVLQDVQANNPTVITGDVPGVDLTNTQYFAILYGTGLGDSTTVYNGDKIYLIQSAEGHCFEAVCAQQNTNLPHGLMTDTGAYIIASGVSDRPTNGTPEPSTFVLLGGSLIGLGATRKRLFRSR